MTLSKNLHWFICILFFLSCAKQSSPTGGPKDTIPPKLVRVFPANESTNFSEQKIELEFSEMIAVNNPNEQLIITPSVGKDIDMKVKKNTFVLTFEKPLKDSTTYTLNFREAIQDVTEKNPARNLQLALSTGAYVDSLSISGKITDLIRNKEVKDVTVAIHPRNDTFNILKHPASYFTKTDTKGVFRIDHLKPDQYYIYAFEDKNRNLVVDSKSESYGFKRDSISLRKDTANISVAIQRLDARPLKITSARPYNTYFNIKTSKALQTFTLTTDHEEPIFSSYGEDQSNIRIYNSFSTADSIAVTIAATDSIGSHIDSLVYAKFAGSERNATPEKFDAALKSHSIVVSKAQLKATISFTKPLREVNFDSLYFLYDSLTKINFTKEDLTYSEPTKTLTLTKALDRSLLPAEEQDQPKAKIDTSKIVKLKKLYTLFAKKAAFISIENDSSKALQQSITPQKPADLSQIELEIKTSFNNFIVQLLDDNFKVLEEKINTKTPIFNDLPAGNYQVRVIVDKNANKAFDAGNVNIKQEPEPIFYATDDSKSQVIKLRANYEIVLPNLLIR
jgi:uncharacterized protein (DUF2141 family)